MTTTLKGLKQALLPAKNLSLWRHSWEKDSFRDELFLKEDIFCPSNVRRSSLKRRCEYFYGRFCARAAIREFKPDFNEFIGTNEDRSPEWPSGIVGSISHCDGFAICVCSESHRTLGVGIDAENMIDAVIAKHIASSLVAVNELEIESIAHWSFETKLTLAFSAKESLFKALYPEVGRYFGFDSAELISADPLQNSFKIGLKTCLGRAWQKGTVLEGSFLVWTDTKSADAMLTSIIVPQLTDNRSF